MMRKKRYVPIVVMVTLCITIYWRSTDYQHKERRNFGRSELPHNSKTTAHGERGHEQDTELGQGSRQTPRLPKVYVYNLPARYNVDIQDCVSPPNTISKCHFLGNGGLGSPLYKTGELGVFRTHMFSLEVILHHQLINSKYVTLNPEEADVFYIPAYLGISYFCKTKKSIAADVENVFNFINSMPYFRQGRPHFSALAKIEREQANSGFPLLQNGKCRNVTYIVIEKEYKLKYRQRLGLRDQRVLVAPYPSYVHLDPQLAESQTITTPPLHSRKVFMFLAASNRRTIDFRSIILNQILTKVRDVEFDNYNQLRKETGFGTSSSFQAWLITEECHPIHTNLTVEWMQNSVFCLQPHGDSPTRKSFYDSIQSGCIPVIFKFDEETVVYPFQRVLNYTDFVVTIHSKRVIDNREFVVNILKEIPKSEIERLHNNVKKVARQLQYSVLNRKSRGNKNFTYVDALDMIMDEIKYMYHL